MTIARPVRPGMLSHVAYITHDTEATVAFYTEVLGMELVNAVLDDAIPSTGDPVPYFHSFFRMGDGSTVAFFEAPELPPAAGSDPPGLRRLPAPRHAGRQPGGGRPLARVARRAGRGRARTRRPQDHLQHLLPRPQRPAARDHRARRPDWNNIEMRARRVARGVGAGEGDGAPERAGHGNRPQGSSRSSGATAAPRGCRSTDA